MRLLGIIVLMLGAGVAFAQSDSSSAPVKGKKLCVADVANSSMKPIFTDKVKARIVEGLQKQQLNAVDEGAITLLANELGMSREDKRAFSLDKCDYMLLSEVAKPPAAAGAAGEANQIAVNFALFAKGKFTEALLRDSSVAPVTDDPMNAALTAADGVAPKVAPKIVKK